MPREVIGATRKGSVMKMFLVFFTAVIVTLLLAIETKAQVVTVYDPVITYRAVVPRTVYYPPRTVYYAPVTPYYAPTTVYRVPVRSYYAPAYVRPGYPVFPGRRYRRAARYWRRPVVMPY